MSTASESTGTRRVGVRELREASSGVGGLRATHPVIRRRWSVARVRDEHRLAIWEADAASAGGCDHALHERV